MQEGLIKKVTGIFNGRIILIPMTFVIHTESLGPFVCNLLICKVSAKVWFGEFIGRFT